MTIVVASDHRGVALKAKIIQYLKTIGIHVIDQGPTSEEQKVDYPKYAEKTAKTILMHKADYGILICNTGIGMSIAANRFKGIRAALCHNKEYAKMAKLHNDANILVFGSGYITTEESIACIQPFLESKYEEERHVKRLKMLDE